MKEYGWTHRERSGEEWLEYGRVRVIKGRRGPLEKVVIVCDRPGDLTVALTVGEMCAAIGAMIAIQQRDFTGDTPMERRLLGIDGWVREVAEVGRDLEMAGEIAADADRIWMRVASG